MDHWFTTTPPFDDEYIVTCKGARKATALRFENGKWTDVNNKNYEVEAWQFFPPAYKN